MTLTGGIAAAQTSPDSASVAALKTLSLDDLMNIEVTSVSKAAEPLSDAAAAIYVITHDEILRSGANTLPDMLRLAPNLQVAQITASSFAITARGFNGPAASKLLVLIDGRSVYTPFHSGVDWGVQNVPPDDIERIEVISGPGAALWGANAVNGVINIITRRSSDTQGGEWAAGGGTLQDRATAQYGATNGALSYRAYVDDFYHGNDATASGTDARDAWKQTQGGFRSDWNAARDLVTVQGDFYQGTELAVTAPDTATSGDNVITRWNHQMTDGSAFQLQAYYDREVSATPGGTGDYLDTYDLDFQHSFAWGSRQSIVWGGGYRTEQDYFPIAPSSDAFFLPVSRTLNYGNVFFQDSVALTQTLKLVLGTKLEDDTYTTLEPLPSARLSWKVSNRQLLWAAVSRAIRAPSRLDRDLYVEEGSLLLIKGGDFKPETLVAYETGYRAQPTSSTSISVSVFYNVYHDLRSAQPTPVTVYPIFFANGMAGDTHGVELWGQYSIFSWWHLSVGGNWLHENLHFTPGSSNLGGLALAGDDPSYQASVRSTMNLPGGWMISASLRQVGALPAPASPAYTSADARIAWNISPTLQFSLLGSNLLSPHHLEFGTTAAPLQLGSTGVETERSVYAQLRWHF